MANMRMRALFTVAAFLAFTGLVTWGLVRSKPAGCQWTRPSDTKTIENDGVTIILALDEHKARTGGFPPSLATAGIPSQSPYGPWRYELRNGEFSLALGQYETCFWEVSYSSKDRSWYHDS